jgi:hypothetical protein
MRWACDDLTGGAEDKDAYGDVVLDREVDAGLRDFGGRIGRDLILNERLLSRFIGDHKLVNVLSG